MQNANIDLIFILGIIWAQVRYMHLWFNQAGMPGRITRLLSAAGNDHLGEFLLFHLTQKKNEKRNSKSKAELKLLHSKCAATLF